MEIKKEATPEEVEKIKKKLQKVDQWAGRQLPRGGKAPIITDKEGNLFWVNRAARRKAQKKK